MEESETQELTEDVAEHRAPEPQPPRAEPQPEQAAAGADTDSADQPPGRSLRPHKKDAAGAPTGQRHGSVRRRAL